MAFSMKGWKIWGAENSKEMKEVPGDSDATVLDLVHRSSSREDHIMTFMGLRHPDL